MDDELDGQDVTAAKVEWTNKDHPELGRIMRVTYDDGVRVYFTKKGLTLRIPPKHESFKAVMCGKRDAVEVIFRRDDLDILKQALEMYIKGPGG